MKEWTKLVTLHLEQHNLVDLKHDKPSIIYTHGFKSGEHFTFNFILPIKPYVLGGKAAMLDITQGTLPMSVNGRRLGVIADSNAPFAAGTNYSFK